jgi:hypothetical protein
VSMVDDGSVWAVEVDCMAEVVSSLVAAGDGSTMVGGGARHVWQRR